jgi:hypothetical protein
MEFNYKAAAGPVLMPQKIPFVGPVENEVPCPVSGRFVLDPFRAGTGSPNWHCNCFLKTVEDWGHLQLCACCVGGFGNVAK